MYTAKGTNQILTPNFHPSPDKLLDKIPGLIICIDENGLILYSNHNPSWKKLQDLQGQNYYSFLYSKDHDRVRKLHEKVLTTGKPEQYEIKNKIAAENHLISAIAYQKDILLLTIQAPAEYHNNMQACMLCGEDHGLNLIQSIILLLDAKGKIVSFNSYMEKISGYRLDEVKGKNWFSVFIPKDETNRIRSVFKHTLSGKMTKGNINAIVTKNGGCRIIEWYARKIQDSNDVIAFGQDITERINVEQALRENEAQLTSSLKLAKIGTWIFDLESSKFLLNDQFYELFRIDPVTMGGYIVSLAKYLKYFISPDDHPVYRRLISDAVLGGEWSENIELEHPFTYGNGEKGHVSVRLFRVRNNNGKVIKILGANQDITQRVKSEEALRTSEKQLSHAQTIAKLGYWEYNVAENLFHFNDHFYSIFKTSVKKVGSYTMSPEEYVKTFFHPEDIDLVRKENVLALTTKDPDFSRHLEHRVIFADGTIGYISVHYFIIKDKNGKTVKTYGANQDITHHKEVERKLEEQNEKYQMLNNQLNESLKRMKQMNRELEEAKIRAEESDQLKSAFLANMSHEIRTPMNGIIGFSKLLNKQNLSEDRRKHYINIINDMCHQLLNLINDIVDISKIETGQIKVHLTKTNINDMMYHLFSFYKQVAAKNNINLYMKKGLRDDESEIETDATKLRQILDNLLGNALKFTHEGFVNFGYVVKKSEIEFFVEDTGIGIPAELQQTVFDRFAQVHIESDKVYGGTGLGLAISKAYVEKMGGHIRIHSDLGKGSTFYFTIPCKLPDIVDEPADNKNAVKLSAPKIRILVVEDEDYNYLYLEELLLEMDVDILHAKSGREAIKHCQTYRDISLILMDIKLPDINGFEVLKKVKKILPHVPVIAQTAYALSGDKEISIEMGFSDYLSKPIDDVEFTNKIRKYIDEL